MTIALHRQALTWAVVLVLACVVLDRSLGAPITFNTALPVAEGEAILRGQAKYLRSTDDPTPMDRELEVWAFPLVGVYGLTDKVALFGIIPFLDKEIEVSTPTGRHTRGDTGHGDVTLLVRYTAYQGDQPGETFRLAPFVGIETPTGDDNERDSLGPLPQPLQLGSGSWDPLVGLVGTWQTLQRQVDVSASYKFNSEANDFDLGDEVRLDASYQHRLWPRNLGGGVPAFLYGVMESNLAWRNRNEIGGKSDRNSGGVTWHLAPGIQYVTKRIVLEAAVQLPIVQDLNGDALENDFITTLSARMNF